MSERPDKRMTRLRPDGFPTSLSATDVRAGDQVRIAALEADRDRLREALHDFASLLPPDRWRLLRLATTKTMREVNRAALNEQGEGERPPPDFWRGVPCGHPPDPVAWRSPEGLFVCHCGNSLDPTLDLSPVLFVREAPGPVVSCGKCGCHVACPLNEQSEGG